MLFVFGAIKIQTVHTTDILQSIFTKRKIFLTLENLKIGKEREECHRASILWDLQQNSAKIG